MFNETGKPLTTEITAVPTGNTLAAAEQLGSAEDFNHGTTTDSSGVGVDDIGLGSEVLAGGVAEIGIVCPVIAITGQFSCGTDQSFVLINLKMVK